MHRTGNQNALRRILLIVASFSLTTTMVLLAGKAAAADTIQTIVTPYQPTVNETVDASGFKHPGVGHTKEVLENMRAAVRAQKEPWNTYFNQMLLSAAASRTVGSSNQGADPTKPNSYAFNSQGFNSRFIADGLKAYTQAVLYFVSGDEVYRANAMRIIRIWSQMDPAQYVYFNDSHIHTGIPLNRMVAAAEIMRYTSAQTAPLQWTEQDTIDFTKNLITPTTDTFNYKNSYFMNQHLYPLIGSMSGYIFTGNRARYNEGVEWFTVNRTAIDQGQNGAIKQLFRLVEKNDLTGEPVVPPVVQHVEMGRDQAHGAGDITNTEILARLLIAQGTKVDPVDGTASTAPDAVGPYEFLNDRILDASEYFANYMLGYDTPWVPTAAHTDANGNPTIIYKQLAGGYRGRLTQNTWELFYYYKYVKGINIEERAPFFTKMFSQRVLYNWDGVDGGGDFWLFIPPAAEAEGTQYLVKPVVDPYRELEDRFSAFDGQSIAMQDATASFVQINATPAGSRIALIGSGANTRNIAFRVRTNGVAVIDAFNDTITLPDTKGEWKYVTYAFNPYQGLHDLLYLTIKGSGTTVDIDHINVQAGTLLTPPVFAAGSADLNIFTHAGSTTTINTNFSATDPTATDVVTYQIDHLPAGAVFDPATGAFSWKPAQAGTYSFVVTASDGNTVTTRDVKVVVSIDRQAAVSAVIAPYNANTLYIGSTLAKYNQAYADIVAAIAGATDDDFFQKLASLNTAVVGLQQLTPLMGDGSMDYTNMFLTSTFGTAVPNALDNSPDSFVGFSQAQNLTHTFDFGPSFKVSATAFQLQVRASFPERIGGVAMFGSNDKENWTRLTPGLSTVTEDMQTLPVQDDLKNQRFRFLKMQMIAPSSTMLELSEFRIFGARFETVNQLSTVSISSAQALANRIVIGHTVKLSLQSVAPINNVIATIQGQPATVATTDNLNWTATVVVDAGAAAGAVKFNLNYKTAEGIDAASTIFTTDGTSLFIADQTALITNLLDITTLIDSSGRNPADLLATANLLFDNNLNSVTDFRVNGSGFGSYITFDFKEGGFVTLSKVEVIGRQDTNYTRTKGIVVQGSNDNVTWETISGAAGATKEWQALIIASTQPYRYIRIFNGNNWFGNMAELRLHGVAGSLNQIASASLSSAQSLRNRIVPGNTVKLLFKAKQAINNVNVTIQGQAAAVSTTDDINFTATAIMNQGAAAGPVKAVINYKLPNGEDGFPNTSTTDNSKLDLVDESDVIRNVTGIATLIDSTSGRTAATTLAVVNSLFDANLGSISDFRIGSANSGTGSYITFDFKEGNQVTLRNVELAPRQDSTFGRIRGTVIQGSNDNATWDTLTAAAGTTLDWQTLAVSSQVPYRYIRIFNGLTWFGNMSEVRFHGVVHAADVRAPVTTANAPGGWVNQDTTVLFNATDASSGVAASYFRLNGGEQQTGNAVTLTAEGIHTLTYWSVDWAGNVEQQQTVTVSIDKTAPVTAATSTPALPKNGWYAKEASVSFSASSDAASAVSGTYFKVDGGAQQAGNTVALNTKGLHTVEYWSADMAGNEESKQLMTVKIGPLDVSPSVQVTQHGATLNRVTGKYVGSVTVTNSGSTALTEPLQLKLNALTTGVTLDNASGTDAGAPYIGVTSPLNAGASINVPLMFTNPAQDVVSYTPTLYIGSF